MSLLIYLMYLFVYLPYALVALLAALTDNFAAGSGGAIYVLTSSLTSGGNVSFSRNRSPGGGGAVCVVSDNSNRFQTPVANFFNQTGTLLPVIQTSFLNELE